MAIKLSPSLVNFLWYLQTILKVLRKEKDSVLHSRFVLFCTIFIIIGYMYEIYVALKDEFIDTN